jgi:hypothetical protein
MDGCLPTLKNSSALLIFQPLSPTGGKFGRIARDQLNKGKTMKITKKNFPNGRHGMINKDYVVRVLEDSLELLKDHRDDLTLEPLNDCSVPAEQIAYLTDNIINVEVMIRTLQPQTKR